MESGKERGGGPLETPNRESRRAAIPGLRDPTDRSGNFRSWPKRERWYRFRPREMARRRNESMPYSQINELSAPDALLRRVQLGLLLVLVSPPVFAQEVPLWLVVGVVSPALALMLVASLALISPGRGKAGLHLKLLVLWIVAFLLASFFIENDWVIWTPMHLYILHLAVLPICVFRQVLGRIETANAKLSRTALLGFLSVLLSVPVTLFVTSLAILPWEYFGKLTGIDTMGRQGPATWCFLATWIVLQMVMLVVWWVHRREQCN